MDATQPPPAEPALPPPHPSSHARILKMVAGATIIIAGIVTVLEFGFPYPAHRLSGTSAAFIISAGPAPASVLYTINTSTNTLAPLTVMVDGKELPALDAQKAADGSWYYILAEPSPMPVGNLYVQKADGSVTRLTSSATAKYNLSYDAQSGKLAYQAVAFTNANDFFTNQKWNIVIFDPSEKTELVIGKGMNPQIVTGGESLIFRDGDELDLMLAGTSATSTIMRFTGTPVYAIRADEGRISVYNALTHKIDTFALTQGASPSYLSSDDSLLQPNAMGYVNDTLVAAYPLQKDKSQYFSFSQPALNNLNPVVVPALPDAQPQRIYAYEK